MNEPTILGQGPPPTNQINSNTVTEVIKSDYILYLHILDSSVKDVHQYMAY